MSKIIDWVAYISFAVILFCFGMVAQYCLDAKSEKIYGTLVPGTYYGSHTVVSFKMKCRDGSTKAIKMDLPDLGKSELQGSDNL